MSEDSEYEDPRKGDEYYYFKARVNAKVGKRLVHILREAGRNDPDPECARRFKHMAQDLVEAGKGEFHTYRRPVKRPQDDDEMALDWVIKGILPYPVLSKLDAHRAFVAMDGNETTAEMARRLYVDEHTIGVWRKQYNEGKLRLD